MLQTLMYYLKVIVKGVTIIIIYSGSSCTGNVDVYALRYAHILGTRFAKEWLWHGFDYIKGLFSTQALYDRLSQ